jgi:ABC-2 type transport system ATP-binding protein
MTPIVEIRDVVKRYADFSLGPASLALPGGSITGLFGPSGSGKTTLVKILAAVHRADSGSVRLFGHTFREREKEIKNRLGYVGEEQFFPRDRTVDWTARYVAQFYERWDWSSFRSLAERFSLDGGKQVGALSRGRRALLALAISLAHNAELLILDEPTAGLDMIVRRDILDTLRDFVSDESRAVLLSSHITDALADVSDYVALLDAGRIILHEEKDELLADWKWIHFRSDALPGDVIDRLKLVRTGQLGSSGLTNEYRRLKPEFSGAEASGEIRTANATLDDVMIALVKGS